MQTNWPNRPLQPGNDNSMVCPGFLSIRSFSEHKTQSIYCILYKPAFAEKWKAQQHCLPINFLANMALHNQHGVNWELCNHVCMCYNAVMWSCSMSPLKHKLTAWRAGSARGGSWVGQRGPHQWWWWCWYFLNAWICTVALPATGFPYVYLKYNITCSR